MTSLAVPMPPPLALTRPTDTLSPPGVRSAVVEPKWDGYRCSVANGRIWSRRGTELTRFFPDLAPVLAARLSARAVLDGELVAWDVEAGCLDFAGLQARLTAGHSLGAAAARRPAQLVCFDLLALGETDLRPRPLAQRRQLLTELLAGLSSPIVLCQQSEDAALGAEWLQTLSAGGLEGVVIKDATQPYPTRPGQRIWHKLKTRHTIDMLAVGVVGDPSAPTSLVLAMPAMTAELPAAGATTVLSRATARALAPLLEFTGQSWARRSSWATPHSVQVRQIRPLVVEISADVAIDNGVLRHAARLVRTRPDLPVSDVVDP